jgi:pentatricopeptide repeat protein
LQFHCLATKSGFDADIGVRNAILDLYGKCKALVEACLIFQDMEQRDSVSWNVIIAAIEQNGRHNDAVAHFNEMLRFGMEPDDFTYGSVLKAYSALQSLEFGLIVMTRLSSQDLVLLIL